MSVPVPPGPPPPPPRVADRLVHALTPVVVIVCATVLGALSVIDPNTTVVLITTAGGYGAIAVAASKPKT